MPHPFRISKDTQALFITIVTHKRLAVFSTAPMKELLCRAIHEARQSGKFLIFAYVIMCDHVHIVTSCPLKPSDVLRVLKGITARRVIDYLKENNYQTSLAKLKHQEQRRNHNYSLWQTEKNVLPLFSEGMFMQKVNYIHQNPVREGLVERAIDYRWSSARAWSGCQQDDEPLLIDKDLINWSRSLVRNVRG
jgi:putative transposase